jgi:hypothetical protein
MRVVALMATFCALLVTGIYRYLPYHLQFLYQRAVYYLSGTEQKDWTSVRGFGVAMLSTKAPHAYTAEFHSVAQITHFGPNEAENTSVNMECL